MSSPKDHRKEKVPKGEEAKGLGIPQKEHAAPATTSLEVYPSSVNEEGLSLIQLAYYVLDEFELELHPIA